MTDNTQRSVYAIATMDTKGDELNFVAKCLRDAGVATKTVDVSTAGEAIGTPDVTREQVIENGRVHESDSAGDHATVDRSIERGAAVTAMGVHLRNYMVDQCRQGRVSGVIGIGGSGGTALITAAMRALDIGLPKVMVSTVASGNTAPYIDCSDITMMYSVVDVAGLNNVSRRVLSNAAHAMAGMVSHSIADAEVKTTIGMTMFGVTTPCVSMVRQSLEQLGNECLVFHATGTGGRAMEQLVESGLIQGVLDVTTTEVADEIVGGVFPAGAQRFDRILSSRIPYVLSLGALDMVNFGAVETVPEPLRDRKLHVHNAQVTLMRTNAQENEAAAVWIANKLNRSTAPLTVVIPELGVSSLDIEGGPFHDPEANAALFDTLTKRLEQTATRRILRLPLHINDPAFADAIVAEYHRVEDQCRG
ncbi:MAG: Tm-1-like ATP-binding domain-containing protein [Planctomycetales bacterium]|nr:Tm-1-like ATP-binding domain-containing protein [Planctomycetales bacterium]